MQDKNYTIPEVAKIVGICEETVRSWIKIHELTADENEFGFTVVSQLQLNYLKQVNELSKSYPRGCKNKQEIIKKAIQSKKQESPESTKVSTTVKSEIITPDPISNTQSELSNVECDSVIDFLFKCFLESDPNNSKFTWIFKRAIDLEKRNIFLEEENKRLKA